MILRTIPTTSIAHQITELRQKIMLMDERMWETNHYMTKLEQGSNTLTSQAASWELKYADVLEITSFSASLIRTRTPAERLEKT